MKKTEEEIILGTEGEIILLPEEGKILIEHLSELLGIGRVETLKRFVTKYNIIHYVIAGKWVIELSSFWKNSLDINDEELE